MAGKRVLFFGVTGVEKRQALEGFGAWVQRHRTRPKPTVVDFEHDYLFNIAKGGKNWYEFLDDAHHSQRRLWLEAWRKFTATITGEQKEDLFVSIHGCIVRGYYGVRSVIDATRIAQDFRPDIIVTLLDDVYDMWWRTEARAQSEPWAGRPTLEQLLFARRAELLMADQVAFDQIEPIPNFVISVAHPCETLANRIYSLQPTVVYLCFPISAPRDLEQAGDPSGINEVTEFLKEAYKRQHNNPDLVIVCPLAIDELPLLNALQDESCHLKMIDKDTKKNEPFIHFDRDARRWSLEAFWDSAGCLTPGAPDKNNRKRIPKSQLIDATGMIRSDVSWRDYRLVAQASDGCLAAFNPKFKNRDDVSRSVAEEIRFASTICPVFVFQDREHDPNGIFEQRYPPRGTMVAGPGTQMVSRKDSVNDVFDAVEALARRRLP